jgi:hypothetical protein
MIKTLGRFLRGATYGKPGSYFKGRTFQVILLLPRLLFRSATHTWSQEEHSLFEATETIVIGHEELVSCSSDYSTRWQAIK